MNGAMTDPADAADRTIGLQCSILSGVCQDGRDLQSRVQNANKLKEFIVI